MKRQSVFDKYSNYTEDVILLAIETMTPYERVSLKKGYGKRYDGYGTLQYHEHQVFELADSSLGKRIEKVDKLLKEGKTKEEIIERYTKSYAASSMYLTSTPKVVLNQPKVQTVNRKLAKTFIGNFALPMQKTVQDLLKNMSEEEKEIITDFYWGKNYDILNEKDHDEERLKEFMEFIDNLRDEALDIIHNGSKKNKERKKAPTKTTKKESLDNIEPLLTYFKEYDCKLVIEVVELFYKIKPDYYNILNKVYSGKQYEIISDIAISNNEKQILKSAIERIKVILNYLIENNLTVEEYLNELNKQRPTAVSKTKQEKKEELKQILSNKETVDNYISNLEKYEEEMIAAIIHTIAETYPDKIIDIINSEYMKKKMSNLTPKEIEYMYLRLLSYSNPNITDEFISKVLNTSVSDYQVMSSDDTVNNLLTYIYQK